MAYNEKLRIEVEADNKASDSIDKVKKSVKDLDDATKRTGKSAEDASNESISGLKKLESAIDNIEKRIGSINRATRQYNTMMGGLNRGIINMFEEAGEVVADFTSDAINNFTDLSEQHAKTLGAMANNYDKTSESQAKFLADAQKLKDQAISLGTFGVNGQGALTDAVGVSEAQTELIKAGLTADDILKSNATKSVLTFAQANDISTDDAVEFAVSLGNQFDIPVDKWDLMLDKVSHTADLSIIGVNDIVQSMKYASGISAGTGKSIDEVLGTIGVLGDFGLRGSQAGSSIQALVTRMLTGDSTVITDAQVKVAPPKALAAFNKFEKEAKPNGELLPMADVVDQLDEVMGTLNDEEQAWFAKKLFGLYQMKGAYALINGDGDALADTIANITNESEGTNLNKLNQILESQYGQLTSLNNMWESVKTDMGNRINPMVDAIRDELYRFLSSNGNYEINFDNLRTALDKSTDLIEEKYGTALADAVRNVGTLTIDLSEIVQGIAPEFGAGLLNVFKEAIQLDIPGSISEWNDMIIDMKDAAKNLPADLRDMGVATVNVIDLFGKLAAFNVAMQGLEGATNLVLLVTNISSAATTLVGLLGGIPGLVLAVGGIAALLGVSNAASNASANMDRESVSRNVFQFDNYDRTTANTEVTTGMNAKFNEFLSTNGIAPDSDVASLMNDEMSKYMYEQSLQNRTLTVDEYGRALRNLYAKYQEIISGSTGLFSGRGEKLNSGVLDNTTFGSDLYKFDERGNIIGGTQTTLYSELYNYMLTKIPGMEDRSKIKTADIPVAGFSESTNSNELIQGKNNVMFDDPNVSFWDRLGGAFSKDAWKYGYGSSNGDTFKGGNILAGLSNLDQLLGYETYRSTGIAGWWYDNGGSNNKRNYNQEVSNAMTQNMISEAFKNVDWNKAFSNINVGNTDDDGQYGIDGWAALSSKGLLERQNEINTNLQLTPQINIAAPNVNVDVKVDKDGNVSKNISILDPNFGPTINTWWNRNLSQYGRTNK